MLTGYGAVAHTARVAPGETVAVIGCGGIGLSAGAGALLAGAGRIIAIDRQPAKLELARQFGATDVIDASSEDVVAKVLDMTNGGVHHAFEAIGLKATAEQSFAMIARRIGLEQINEAMTELRSGALPRSVIEFPQQEPATSPSADSAPAAPRRCTARQSGPGRG